jgi:RES domain-containing protein
LSSPTSNRTTKVYRVLRRSYARTPFDGQGAFLYGGRWSSAGTRLSYASEHQSLAMLEYFVHLDPDERIEVNDLPANCRETPAPPELARIGDDFAQRAKCCLLLVPSVLAMSETNWLLNSEHADFQKIAPGSIEALSYDSRMFGERTSRSGKPIKKRRVKHTSK